MLRHLDRVARRYGVRPSSLLEGGALNLGIDVLCALEGAIAEAEMVDRAIQDGAWVVPSVVLAGG